MPQKNETILKILTDMRNIMLLNKPVWTVDDVCCFTGYKPTYVYKMVFYKQIPYCKSPGGSKLFFKRENIIEWVTSVEFSNQCSVVATKNKLLKIK
jgi:predicted DNA-binding transcriptional regulator AlpA